MENKNNIYSYSLKYKRQSSFNPNLISKLFFEFDEKNSRSIKFEKVNEIIDDNINIINDISNINYNPSRNHFRDKLMSQIEYIYTEAKKPKPSESLHNILIDKKVQSSKNIIDSIFETQLKNNSIIIPKMKRKKKEDIKPKNLLSTDNTEDEMPKYIHTQIIPLKGKKNKTYKFKYKNIPKGINYINIHPINKDAKEIKYFKNLDDYEMRYKLINMRKEIFKV